MRNLIVIVLLCVGATRAMANSTPRQDALIASYFAIWDDDSNVTLDNVARLYAPRIIYYGHPMTRQDLLGEKINFTHQWPIRHYGVEPGSVSKRCDAQDDHCLLTATLVWRTSSAKGGRAGRSRVSLALARVDGGLKIVRESGVTLPSAVGTGTGPGRLP